MSEKLFGLDVSHFQPTVDWARVAKAGKVFAFVKASEGALTPDALFETNRTGATANKVIVGAYHLFHPGKAVADQVKLFVGKVKAIRPGELPPVLDLEVPDEWEPVAQADRMKLVTAWVEQVENALGVKPIIYAGPDFVDDVLGNDPRLATYRLWLAAYRARPDVPDPWPDWAFWQFTDKGSTDGITGKVDLDLFNGSVEELKTLQFPQPAPAVVTAAKSVAIPSVTEKAHPLVSLIDASEQIEAAQSAADDVTERRVLAEALRHVERAIATLSPGQRRGGRRSGRRPAKAARRSKRRAPNRGKIRLRSCEVTALSTKWSALSPLKRLLALASVLPVLAVVGLAALEHLTSDAATRLAFQIRNQKILLKLSGESTRTFRHSPWSWPSGVSGDYRIEIKEGANPSRPGDRFIGVARNLTEPTWFTTTYHLNFVEVPVDLKVSHHKGEDTFVTLEMRDGKVLLTRLE